MNLVRIMHSVSGRLSEYKGMGILILVASFLSFLTYAMFYVEYGIFQFPDTDLPPYPRETLLEKFCDLVWSASVFGAVIVWAYIALLVFVVIFRIQIRRRYFR